MIHRIGSWLRLTLKSSLILQMSELVSQMVKTQVVGGARNGKMRILNGKSGNNTGNATQGHQGNAIRSEVAKRNR